jgi:tripartite-type tricarboxylate transporter receptor subunit TctC
VHRLAAFPEVPTFAESGISDFVVEHWWGVLAPAGVAPPIVVRLHDAIVKAVGAADVRERFETLAVQPATNAPGQFHALLASEVMRWAKVVKGAGIKAN